MIFMPKIIGFICNWSLPTGVDIAIPSTIHGYPKIGIVRVMCVGRVDPAIVLETFAKGADGVLVIGCHPPDCHFMEGNLQAERRIKTLKKLVSKTGLEQERLRLDWAYASEAERFTKIIDDFRNQVMVLGPSPLAGERPDTNILLNIKAAKAAAEDFRLRFLVGRERGKIDEARFKSAIEGIFKDEISRWLILKELERRGPLTIKDLSEATSLPKHTVVDHMMALRWLGRITSVGEKDDWYLYALSGK